MATDVQTQPKPETDGRAADEQPRDGISIELDTVAGPISIVRTTQKATLIMQHC